MRKLVTLLIFFAEGAMALSVNWSLSGPNPIKEDSVEAHSCEYSSVLVTRPPKRHSDPEISTLSFRRATSLPKVDHEMCQLILSNLTNLDQQAVKDQLATIISKFPCPDAEIQISTFHSRNPALKIIAPNARSPRTLRSLIVDGCLAERLPECTIPMSRDPGFMMTFEDMKDGLTRCGDAMNSAVLLGAEIATWQNQNNPNKTTSLDVPHVEPLQRLQRLPKLAK